MTIRDPAVWVRIAKLVAKAGPMSSIEVAHCLDLSTHSVSNTCGAMARRGFLQCVGKTARPGRRDAPSRSQSRIYTVTDAGAALETPPIADHRTARNAERPSGTGWNFGPCALAECLGLGRR